ncbi:MAG: autotransporter outer membrane beta-barrel domain-containing protein [Ferribacterium limneticum]
MKLTTNRRSGHKAVAVSGLALMLLSVSANAVVYTPPTTTVEFNGYRYVISSANVNYNTSPTGFTSQPWWGNQSLGTSLAALVQMSGGGYFGTNTDGGILFAYGENGSKVKLVYWQSGNSSVYDCDISCNTGFAQSWYYANLVSMSQLVNLADLLPSLASAATGFDSSTSIIRTMVNGAHSSPLSHRVAAGQKTFWVAGDWGRDDHGNRSGSVGLAEINGGYNFGPVQVNVSYGKTWSNQNLILDGKVDASGDYVMTEAIIPISEERGVFATVGAFGHWGNIDTKRSYVSTGVIDTSSGDSKSNSWGVRARVDWEKAFTVKPISFSPYIDLSYLDYRMKTYTETGGGLPARFNGRTEESVEMRVGLNALTPIAGTPFNLVTNLEAAQRFGDNGVSTTGEIIGLASFNVSGQSMDRSWLKAGLGVEGKVLQGKASIMLNGTTQSQMPNFWMSATYQVAF